MYRLLIRMDVLSNWIIAHLLTMAFVYSLTRRGYIYLVVEKLEDMTSKVYARRLVRLAVYLITGAFLASPVVIPLRSSPAQAVVTHPGNDPLLGASHLSLFSTPVMGNLMIAAQIFVLMSAIPITNRIFVKFARSIQIWRHTRFRVVKFQDLEIFTPDQLADVATTAARYVKLGIQILVISVSLALLFSLYPVTEGLAQALWAKVTEGMVSLWKSFLGFVPNLITLIAIVLMTRAFLKLLRFFYLGIHRGKIRFTGIHYELVEPTYQILRLLVIAFALVAAFPYIPGSSSPVFRGLSIFVGFLLSLGSTSLITNIVAGIVLTYSRGLRMGDRVKIGESMGDVIERTLLVTRVRTIKNEVVTMPNALVLKNEIVNYSTDAEARGLILHTSITIGYDVPWRKVSDLLMGAAAKTPDILFNPSPFVLKTGLEDSYIRYELNAYTARPANMAVTYSDLHQNILDEFSRAEVEITSPSYLAFRDGNEAQIPQAEISSNGNDPNPSPV